MISNHTIFMGMCAIVQRPSASAAILRALTVQRLYHQRDTQRNIISFLTKPYFLQGNTDPEYLVGEISKSNILSHNTPLLAGYPSANISKQKVRHMRFSGLLRPRIDAKKSSKSESGFRSGTGINTALVQMPKARFPSVKK